MNADGTGGAAPRLVAIEAADRGEGSSAGLEEPVKARSFAISPGRQCPVPDGGATRSWEGRGGKSAPVGAGAYLGARAGLVGGLA